MKLFRDDTNSRLTRDQAMRFLRAEDFVDQSTLGADAVVITCTACKNTVWTEREDGGGDLEPGLGSWIYHEERCPGIRARARL